MTDALLESLIQFYMMPKNATQLNEVQHALQPDSCWGHRGVSLNPLKTMLNPIGLMSRDKSLSAPIVIDQYYCSPKISNWLPR